MWSGGVNISSLPRGVNFSWLSSSGVGMFCTCISYEREMVVYKVITG